MNDDSKIFQRRNTCHLTYLYFCNVPKIAEVRTCQLYWIRRVMFYIVMAENWLSFNTIAGLSNYSKQHSSETYFLDLIGMLPAAVTGGNEKAGGRGWSGWKRREARPPGVNWGRRKVEVVCSVAGAKLQAESWDEMEIRAGNLPWEAELTGSARTGAGDIRLNHFHKSCFWGKPNSYCTEGRESGTKQT